MSGLTKASRKLAVEVYRSLLENDGCVGEADAAINRASRAVIAAMQVQHGEAWLGRINRSKDERDVPVFWKWDGSVVPNFGAEFVLPKHSARLEGLLLAREASTAPYSAAVEYARITEILDCVKEAGGITLLWT